MITSALTASNLPPLAISNGGFILTGIQILMAATNFSNEVKQAAPYSKFSHTNAPSKAETMIPSRQGMTMIYTPALVTGSLFYCLSGVQGIGNFLPQTSPALVLLILHFLKRQLEVMFLHKYSGKIPKGLSSGIGIYYAISTCIISYLAVENPSVGASQLGYGLFVLGSFGNFYHHYILAKLRDSKAQPEEKKYIAPQGGLFSYVATPHYLFELIAWLGIAVVSQHGNAFLVFLCMSSYLGGRSVSQNSWNRNTFSEVEWPQSRKNLIPFIF